MKYRRQTAELISDIGAAAFPLTSRSVDDIRDALDFVWNANPELFQWLLDQLNAGASRRAARVENRP